MHSDENPHTQVLKYENNRVMCSERHALQAHLIVPKYHIDHLTSCLAELDVLRSSLG
jgi:hypothetical protein